MPDAEFYTKDSSKYVHLPAPPTPHSQVPSLVPPTPHSALLTVYSC